MSATDCSGFPLDCGQLEPDPDIAGIGVFISFLATSLLTLLAAIARLPCQFVLREPHTTSLESSLIYSTLDRESETGHHPSSIYHAAKEHLRYYRLRVFELLDGNPNHNKYRLVNATLVPMIISLADQQLVTSFAILIAGLKDWQGISAWHFNFVVYLAWFASFTHTVALISLNDYFQHNPSLAILRMVGYMSNFILFAVAQSSARGFGKTVGLLMSYKRDTSLNSEGAACLAKCAAAVPYRGNDHILRIVLMSILFLQALIHWIPESARTDFNVRLYNKCLNILCISSQKRVPKALAYIFQIIILAFWAIPAVGVILGLTFGIYGAVTLRNLNSYPGLKVADDFLQAQNEWTFGQLVAVILLVLPFLAALEGFLEEHGKIRAENLRSTYCNRCYWKQLPIALLKLVRLWREPASDGRLLSRIAFWLLGGDSQVRLGDQQQRHDYQHQLSDLQQPDAKGSPIQEEFRGSLSTDLYDERAFSPIGRFSDTFSDGLSDGFSGNSRISAVSLPSLAVVKRRRTVTDEN